MRLDRLITLYLARPLLHLRNSVPRRPTSDLRPLSSRGQRSEVRSQHQQDDSDLRPPTSDLRPLSSVLRLPILMYHSISDDPEPGVHPYYRTCTSPKRFAEHMQWLKELGYHGVTLTQGLEWLKVAGRGQKSEVGSRKSEVGSRKSEVRRPRSEVRSQRSEVGSQKSAIQSPLATGGRN